MKKQCLTISSLFTIILTFFLTTAFAGNNPERALQRGAKFFLDYNNDSIPDRQFFYGIPTDIGLVGDFNGDTMSDLTVFRNGIWYVSFYNDAVATWRIGFGAPTDIPLTADLNGDGLSDFILFRATGGYWYVKYNTGVPFLGGIPDQITRFGGLAGDIPVLGDFDGDGTVDRAIYRSGRWYIDLEAWNGNADRRCNFGGPGDIPIAYDAGDTWTHGLGIFRNGAWYVDTDCDGIPNKIYYYGTSGDKPLTGFFNTADSIFVNANVSPGGSGTQRSPFSTIGDAIALAGTGDIIRIAAGTYTEFVSFSSRSQLTFKGAGWNATHITAADDPSRDAFSAVISTDISVSNLHVSTQYRRGIVVQGSSVTLDRVSTVGNRDHNVLATGYLGSSGEVTIKNSRLDQSQIGAGLWMQGGSSGTILNSSFNLNGTAPPSEIPTLGGVGIKATNEVILNIDNAFVNDNYDGGIILDNTQTSPATVSFTNCEILRSGTNGVYIGHNVNASFSVCNISYSGTRGSPGATTGFNGIEINPNWNGASMIIESNYFAENTTNGVMVGNGTVTVTNNFFDKNWLGMTIFNSNVYPAEITNVTIQGNTFLTLNPTLAQTGIFMQETWGDPTVTIGGALAAEQNTFQDFDTRPAMVCQAGTANTICGPGWNIFINSPVIADKCSCSN